MASTPCAEGIEAIMFRTIGDGPSEWESLLPPEVLGVPAELARVDALLVDPVFFAPFAQYFHPVLGRPGTPAEWYLRLMFLKSRHGLGVETLCAEVSDSISWRRVCRSPLDARVPHPTTLMQLTGRGGDAGWGRRDAGVGGRNGRHAGPKAISGRVRGRLVRALDELAVTIGRTATLVAQARTRLAGQTPEGATRLVSLHDPDARPIRKGRIDRPVEFGYKAQVTDNDDGIVLDYSVEYGAAPDGPQLAPAIQRIHRRAGQVPRAVAADRGYGQAATEADLP